MKLLHSLLLIGGLLLGPAFSSVSAAPADLTLRVAPERDQVYSKGSRELVVQIDLDGKKPEKTKRAPMNVALVLDRSGSMQGAKIEKARQAACVAVDSLGDEDYFSLVIFDEQVELLLPPERVGGERHRDELKARINRISPRGSTAIYAGVTLGAAQIKKYLEKEFVNRVVLLSDGLANVGPASSGDFARLGRDLRRDGLSATTVGLGDDYNEDLMTALAESSNANYYYVRDAEKLPGIFAEELGSARSLIARGVKIRIQVPEGVRVKEIVGQPDIVCKGSTVEIALPEYFGGDKRRFLARCVIDEGTSAKALDVAAVDLRYEPADGGSVTPQAQNARVTFTDEEKKSEASVRMEVVKEVAVIENRLAKEEAVRLADAGEAKRSAEVLREQARRNAEKPAAAQVPNMEVENKGLESWAKEVESNGRLGGSGRKQLQYENWQDRYQKR